VHRLFRIRRPLQTNGQYNQKRLKQSLWILPIPC
jgi:hypothetical protein